MNYSNSKSKNKLKYVYFEKKTYKSKMRYEYENNSIEKESKNFNGNHYEYYKYTNIIKQSKHYEKTHLVDLLVKSKNKIKTFYNDYFKMQDLKFNIEYMEYVKEKYSDQRHLNALFNQNIFYNFVRHSLYKSSSLISENTLQYDDTLSRQYLNFLQENRDMPTDASKCEVCFRFDSDDSDYIVYCDGCNISFHSHCYSPAVQLAESNSFFCDRCVLFKNNQDSNCHFCAYPKGPLKTSTFHGYQVYDKTKEGSQSVCKTITLSISAHPYCVMLNPHLKYDYSMANVYVQPSNMVSYNQSFRNTCMICNTNKGSVVRCADPHCLIDFHIGCYLNVLRLDQKVTHEFYDNYRFKCPFNHFHKDNLHFFEKIIYMRDKFIRKQLYDTDLQEYIELEQQINVKGLQELRKIKDSIDLMHNCDEDEGWLRRRGKVENNNDTLEFAKAIPEPEKEDNYDTKGLLKRKRSYLSKKNLKNIPTKKLEDKIKNMNRRNILKIINESKNNTARSDKDNIDVTNNETKSDKSKKRIKNMSKDKDKITKVVFEKDSKSTCADSLELNTLSKGKSINHKNYAISEENQMSDINSPGSNLQVKGKSKNSRKDKKSSKEMRKQRMEKLKEENEKSIVSNKHDSLEFNYPSMRYQKNEIKNDNEIVIPKNLNIKKSKDNTLILSCSNDNIQSKNNNNQKNIPNNDPKFFSTNKNTEQKIESNKCFRDIYDYSKGNDIDYVFDKIDEILKQDLNFENYQKNKTYINFLLNQGFDQLTRENKSEKYYKHVNRFKNLKLIRKKFKSLNQQELSETNKSTILENEFETINQDLYVTRDLKNNKEDMEKNSKELKDDKILLNDKKDMEKINQNYTSIKEINVKIEDNIDSNLNQDIIKKTRKSKKISSKIDINSILDEYKSDKEEFSNEVVIPKSSNEIIIPKRSTMIKSKIKYDESYRTNLINLDSDNDQEVNGDTFSIKDKSDNMEESKPFLNDISKDKNGKIILKRRLI